MIKKIVIAILVLSVIGAIGAAVIYNANKPAEQIADGIAPLASNADRDSVEEVEETEAESLPPAENDLAQAPIEFTEDMGEPWKASAKIVALDDFGMDVTTEAGETVFVELGPPEYWQTQGVDLAVGDTVTIDGTINDANMIHATTVALDEGPTLVLRTETGAPMWSGGASNDHGQQGGADGEHSPEPQAQVDEWITLEGTLMSFQGGNMTMGTTDGELIAFQTGNPRFFAEQGVSFQVGEEIIVVGFYEGDQFMAGDITQVSTGLRVMLRDPNGRPLWAGPGNSNGNGGEGSGNGNQGNGYDTQGNGNGYQGGRNE